MILADTSCLVDHIQSPDPNLEAHLENNEVLVHPFVLGEMSLSNSKQSESIAHQLSRMPKAMVATEDEVHAMVARYRLRGSRIGWVDAHLLASAKISGAKLLTHDLALKQAAAKVLA